MRTPKPEPIIRKSTPVVTIEAAELAPGAFVVRRSDPLSPVRVKTRRLRGGKVRCTFDGMTGVFELPRSAPVNVYEVA